MTQPQRNTLSSVLPDNIYQSVRDSLGERGAQETLPQITALLKKYPEDTKAWMLHGIAMRLSGDLNQAIDSLSKSLTFDPTHAEALYQLGLIMKATGHESEVVALFESVIQHDSQHLLALKYLRDVYLRNHQDHQLVGVVLKIIRASPEQQPSWEWLRQILEQIPSLKLSPEFILFTQEQVRNLSRADSGKSAVAAYLCLQGDPAYREWGGIFGHSTDQVLAYSLPAALKILENPMLQALLARGIVSLHDFELYVRMLRGTLLHAWNEGILPASLPLEAIQHLATYFFRIEFLPEVSPPEEEWLEALQTRLQDRSETSQEALIELLLYACYHPLPTLPSIAHWHRQYQAHPALQQLLRATYEDYLAEQALRASLPRLGSISDTVSSAVREQYEENPYPRWDHLPPTHPMKVMDCIRQHILMNIKAPLKLQDDPNILIAGCGTGMQTLMVANRFPRAKILNVDLSSSSIAYAIRKAKELKKDKNLEFMQADILELGSLNRQFDIVESIGVLHHMQDPMAGWKTITGLLKPGGAMRIGLYSKIARKDIIAAREEIAARGLGDTLEEMRRYRTECLATQQYNFTKTSDFYTTSSLRDLLFHRSERQFTIPQIQSCLDELGLRFLGFTQNGILHERFCAMFPDEPDYSDLAKWQELEEKEPSTFFCMYQFWCYKPR